ncbi:hypothetical protein KKA85_02710 [bacterium]|nr:hypothetical protein [bacterium]MBU1674676.1 hypothetical protein [bacterium]
MPRRHTSPIILAMALLLTAGAALAAPYGSVRLLDPHPRVAAPATYVPFYLDREAHVVLDVLDAEGNPVIRLADAVYPAGRHAVRWRGEDALGERLEPGLYTVRLHVGNSIRTVALPLVG